MFWINAKTKFSKDIVIKDMIERIQINAKNEWITVDEYYKVRTERKERCKNHLDNRDFYIRKKWDYKAWLHIDKVFDYKNIKWGLIEITGWQDNSTVKAYISWTSKKPQVLWNMSRMTYAEKNKVRRIVYWYFDSL